MDMSGERRIPAPRESVWAGLNDPDVLRASIPGCESLEKTADNEFKATASIKIGPIAARFTGKVALTDIDPPNGYKIGGEGQGGVAGFAKGGATVALADDGADTLLTYVVQAQVGGKIAQLGARLIDATAKSMAEQFFTRFAAQVSPAVVAPAQVMEDPPVATAPTEIPTPAAVTERSPTLPLPPPAGVSLLSLIPSEIAGFPLVAWIGAAVCFFIFVLLFGSLI